VEEYTVLKAYAESEPDIMICAQTRAFIAAQELAEAAMAMDKMYDRRADHTQVWYIENVSRLHAAGQRVIDAYVAYRAATRFRPQLQWYISEFKEVGFVEGIPSTG